MEKDYTFLFGKIENNLSVFSRITLFFFLLLLKTQYCFSQPTYCIPSDQQLWNVCSILGFSYNISGVSITNASGTNPFSNATCSGEFYSDKTSLVLGSVEIGSTTVYTLNLSRLQSSIHPTYLYAYVDWNNDGNFTGTGENLISANMKSGTNTSATFTVPWLVDGIPVNAGSHRLRVISSYGDWVYGMGYPPPPTPCASYGGQTYDFTINLTGGCTQPTVQASGASLGTSTATSQILNWSGNGNGSAGVLVVIKAGNTAPDNPSTNSYTYVAQPNILLSSGVGNGGNQTAAGSYVVYFGSGNSVTVTGLSPNSTYSYRIYSANSNCYDLTNPPGGTFTTPEGVMSYISRGVSQVTGAITTLSDQAILQVRVTVNSGSTPVLVMNSLSFNTIAANGGTTNAANIANAKVYYTGTSSTFATTTQFGNAVVNPNGSFTVTGTQNLIPGSNGNNADNYFWMAYDIDAATYPINNYVDAKCTAFNLSGTPYTLSGTLADGDPAGNRQITYCIPSDQQYFDVCTMSGSYYNISAVSITNSTIPAPFSTASCSPEHYADKTATVLGTVEIGNTTVYTLNISRLQNGIHPTYLYAYIDWNNDGNFTGTGENLIAAQVSTGGTAVTGNFTVPVVVDAIPVLPGNHRIRIISSYGDWVYGVGYPPPPTPCSTYGGQTYDFHVNFVYSSCPAPGIIIGSGTNPSALCFSSNPQIATLSYTATLNNPDKYSIIWNNAAVTAGFKNVPDTTFSGSPGGGIIDIAVPASVAAGTYSGTLTVKSVCSAVGTGTIVNITISQNASDAGSITGLDSVCKGQNGVNYSVPAITYATGYDWTVPTGATIVSGANTNSIIVDYSNSASAGDISVTGTSVCGNGITSNLNIFIGNLPDAAGTVTGMDTICAGQKGVIYSVSAISNADGYHWDVPTGTTIVSGANTNSVTIDFLVSATDGTISVNGINKCGDGIASNFTVTVNPATVAGVITANKDTICEGTPASFQLNGNSAGNIQWQSTTTPGNFTPISGATSTDYISTPLDQTNYFRVIVAWGSCADTSAIKVIEVVDAPTAAFTSIVTGLNATFNSSGTSGATVYQWNFGDGFSSDLSDPTHTYISKGTYHVCLTVYSGSNCSFTICHDVTTEEPTGVNNIISADGWSAYPNPFGDYLILDIDNNKNFVETIELCDLLGRTILLKECMMKHERFIRIETASLKHGVYILKIRSNKGFTVQPAIKL